MSVLSVLCRDDSLWNGPERHTEGDKNSGKFMPLLSPARTGPAPLGEEISQRACFPLPRP
ncbi:hypothetical protein DGo_PE0039 (plasmid) [Deinococcus gobiensis I-0]|uniref:Uncharacterized protein n=1 Tax=Deinococcus gobiensis (strain DSM 21396 / JCM 16679 / CGMCC 1.7299 / I-0) TaxID=745776 RepID=H8H3T6_DEIGI|nr:hypothetical protein DGo_PE0039 [Deinococcus gobiensis I-0]